jgi:hypothetical protein
MKIMMLSIYRSNCDKYLMTKFDVFDQPKKVTHFAARDTAENEEDVIERNRTQEIQKEPSSDVVVSDQLRIDYYLLGVVLLHYSC